MAMPSSTGRSQAEQDVVDERDRQGDEHAKDDTASSEQEKGVSNRRRCQRRLGKRIFEQIVVCSCLSVLVSCFPDTGGTYAVLRMSGCTLYSFEKTKGTMPWGRAACSFRHFAKQKTTPR